MDLQNGILLHLMNDSVPIHIYMLCFFGVFLLAYFLGSINSAIIFSRLLYHDDVRKKGSGNAGMTNMFRSFGFKAGILTLICDLLKTVVPIFIGGMLLGFNYLHGVSLNPWLYLIGIAVVLGHVFPIYYRFKGGKGVLASASLALILTPTVFAMLFPLFVITILVSKYVSLGSVIVMVLYPVVLNGYYSFLLRPMIMNNPPLDAIIVAVTIFIAVLTVYTHRKNLARIGDRTENKIPLGKSKKPKSAEIKDEGDED